MAPDPTSTEQALRHLETNELFYIDGGDLHFLVGNIRFRVHRYFFERESKVFREKIERSTAPGQPRQGDNDYTAIILEESPKDFEKLLEVFYNRKYSLYNWNTEEWATLLGLAVKWGFDEVKELALRELDKKDIPLLTRIGLYQRFNIDFDRLVPLYAELCSRPDTLDEEEAEALGLKTAVLVFRARERLRAVPSNEGKSPLPAGLEKDDVHRVIESLRNGSNASVVTSKTESQMENKSDGADPAATIPHKVNKNSNGRTGRPVGANK